MCFLKHCHKIRKRLRDKPHCCFSLLNSYQPLLHLMYHKHITMYTATVCYGITHLEIFNKLTIEMDTTYNMAFPI